MSKRKILSQLRQIVKDSKDDSCQLHGFCLYLYDYQQKSKIPYRFLAAGLTHWFDCQLIIGKFSVSILLNPKLASSADYLHNGPNIDILGSSVKLRF